MRVKYIGATVSDLFSSSANPYAPYYHEPWEPSIALSAFTLSNNVVNYVPRQIGQSEVPATVTISQLQMVYPEQV